MDTLPTQQGHHARNPAGIRSLIQEGRFYKKLELNYLQNMRKGDYLDFQELLHKYSETLESLQFIASTDEDHEDFKSDKDDEDFNPEKVDKDPKPDKGDDSESDEDDDKPSRTIPIYRENEF